MAKKQKRRTTRTTAKKKPNVALCVISILLAIIVALGAVYGSLVVFCGWDVNPLKWGKKEEAEMPDFGGGLEIADKTEDTNIMLMSIAIPFAAYAAYNIPIMADSASMLKAQEIKATVGPEDYADNTELKWDAAFENPSSEWATGKDVSDYLELAYGSGKIESKLCTVTCNAPFSEPIIITVTSVVQPEVNATIRADYRQRITSFDLKLGELPLNMGVNTDVTLELGDDEAQGGMPNLILVGSDTYTLPYEHTATYQIRRDGDDIAPFPQDIIKWDLENGYSYAIGFYADDQTTNTMDLTLKNYDFADFDVSKNGITFSGKFFDEHFHLKEYSHFMNSLNNGDTPYSSFSRDILYAVNKYGDTDYTVEKRLFRLYMTVESESLSGKTVTQWTEFQLTGVHYAPPITGITPDKDHIIF